MGRSLDSQGAILKWSGQPKRVECSFQCCSKKVRDGMERKFRKVFEGNPLPKGVARKSRKVLRVSVDCKIGSSPDLMQPLPKGSARKTGRRIPERQPQGGRERKPKGAAVTGNSGRLDAEEASVGRKFRG